MSLIEEALRKQQQETATDTPGPAPAAAAEHSATAAPPGPPPLEVTRRRTGRKTWLLLAVLGALFLSLAGAVVWLFYAGIFILRREAAPGAPELTPPVAVSTTSTMLADDTSAVTSAPSTGTAVAAASNVETALEAFMPPESATPTAPPTRVAETTVPGATVVTAAPVASLPDVQQLVLWPHLVVSGLMGDSRGVRGTAIINGQLVNVGDTIEGAKVVAVTRTGVTLAYGGETRTLKIGDSTE